MTSQMTSSQLYIVVIVAIRIAMGACPRYCSCDDVISSSGGLRADCRNRALTDHVIAGETFPLPAETEELDVGRNRISSLDWMSTILAATRRRLLRLYADRCEISRIGGAAFSDFQSLEYIDLSFNHIDIIDAGAFSGLPKLRTLRLDGNRLEAIKPHAFRGLTLSILRLDKNRIGDLHPLAFQEFQVETLNLDRNRLARIGGGVVLPLRSSLRNFTVSGNAVPLTIDPDAFVGFSFAVLRVRSSGLRSLSFVEDVGAVGSLDVGGNDLGGVTISWSTALALGCREVRLDDVGLENFDASLATRLRSVRHLDLSANRLTRVDPTSFRPLTDLRRLDLSGNQLASLPPDFSTHLSTLERLNLSSNSISSVDPTSLAGLTRIRQLDLSRNRIQVLPEAVETVLASVEWFDVSGNRLHCNCETRWLRRWLASPALASRHPLDARSVLCGGPGSPSPLLQRSERHFVCSRPRIASSTRSRNVVEGSDVILTCTAGGDPTPSVKWASPFGDVVSVSPPGDRQQRRLSAIWQIRRARSQHSGWYRCNASNLEGSDVAYTYLHVFSPEVDFAADMSGLVYPMIPLPVTTAPTTAAILSTRNSTASPEMNSTADTKRRTTLRYAVDVEPEVTSSGRSRTRMTSRDGFVVDTVVVMVSAACLLVVFVLCLAVFGVRKHRRSGKYDPRVTEPGPRRCPCFDGRGSPDDPPPELDTSTARLKFTNTAADRCPTSFVPDRPLTNGVVTRTDPVQRTLIGPPQTNDELSR